jgi:anti-anti-sigma regulatory factor
MELLSEIIVENPLVSIVHVVGRLDGASYLALVEKARELFQRGTDHLILDLEACAFLSSAGLFALHNIALMAYNYEPLDHENGWRAMKIIADEKRDFTDRFKIVNVPPNIMQTLTAAGVTSLYGIYPDTQAALAALDPVVSTARG